MKQKKSKSFLVLAVLGILSSIILPVKADLVELKTGEIIKGKVISVDSKIVLIRQKPDKIKINKCRVKQITFEDRISQAAKPKQAVTEKSQKPVKKQKKPQVVTAKTPPTLKPVDSKHVVIKPDEDKPGLPLRPKVKISPKASNAKVKTSVVLKPLNHKALKSPSKATSTLTTPVKTVSKSAEKLIQLKTPGKVPAIEYVTYIKGSTSGKTYLGIYSNAPDKNNLTIYLPSKKVSKLSFNLHAQKNGKIPPLYTAASTVFISKSGKIISQTNPIVVDKDNFVEWFRNLEKVAGITGNKNVSITIPPGTNAIKILGYRPASKENLVGYVSDIRLDGTLIQDLNKI